MMFTITINICAFKIPHLYRIQLAFFSRYIFMLKILFPFNHLRIFT